MQYNKMFIIKCLLILLWDPIYNEYNPSNIAYTSIQCQIKFVNSVELLKHNGMSSSKNKVLVVCIVDFKFLSTYFDTKYFISRQPICF